MTVARLLLLLGLGLSLAMAGGWAIGRRRGRSGWIDVVWSFATGAAGIAAALAPVAGGAPPDRGWLVAGLVAAWSLRLGGHIAGRAAGGEDDPRYAELRRAWGAGFAARLFGLLQIQALAAWVLAATLLVAARNPAPWLAWSDIAGAGLLVAAVAGEAVADRQLKAFRAHPANRRRVCEDGLWGLSRHPNYWFEWLGWCAYALIAIGPDGGVAAHWPWGWIALAGPALIYGLLVHVSGIPPLEAHMLRSRGDAFRAVQARVRAFWPIPLPSAKEIAR